MKHAHPNSDFSRFDDDISPLVKGILEARRIREENQENTRRVCNFLKHKSDRIVRPNFTEYEGDDQEIEDTLELFEFDTLLNFQEEAWSALFSAEEDRKEEGKSQGVLLSAPTGYGKTEAFLGPILKLLRDEEMGTVVFAYPRKNLLEDQLGRILEALHRLEENFDRELEVGMWHGDIENRKRDVYGSFNYSTRDGNFAFTNCKICESDEVVNFDWKTSSSKGWYGIECPNGHKFGFPQLKLHRGAIKQSPPDILLTTLESMEQFSLKPNYRISESLDAIVFDETHLYEGIYGAHAANIIKNLKSIKENPLLLVGSSATLDKAGSFAEKIFDLPEGSPRVIEVDEDDKKEGEKKEHLFFVESADQMGLASTYIQELMLLCHSLLQDDDEEVARSTSLNFIDSISQINQREKQLRDAEENELWSFHDEDPDNWPNIASQMGKDFIDQELEIKTNHSQTNLSSSDLEEADMILTSSSMEVGVDLPGIRVVTQYSSPMNYASFIQRIGRAAREEGEESYLMMLLDNNGQDANLMYRADRFLKSEVDIPLNVENPIVKWVHEKNLKFYEVGYDVYNDVSIPDSSKEPELLRRLFRDQFGYEEFWNLIDDPDDSIGEIIGEELGVNTILSEEVVNRIQSILGDRKKEIENEFEEILEFTGESSSVLLQSDTFAQLLEDVEIKGLEMINRCEEELTKNLVEEAVSVKNEEERRDEILKSLEEQREKLNSENSSTDDRLREIKEVAAKLSQVSGKIESLEIALVYEEGEKLHDVDLEIDSAFSELEGFRAKLELMETLASEDIEEYRDKLLQIYYLKKCLENLKDYLGVPHRHWSLYAFKSIMRSAYFYNRCLQVEDQGYGEDIWYIPPNYFGGGGGKTVTFVPDYEYDNNWEEPLTKVFGKYAPYRTQFKQRGPYLQVFQPKTKRKDSGEVVFDFGNISGTRRSDIVIPDSIPMKDVLDRSDKEANGIVEYCPECYHLIGKENLCPRHSESRTGRIHGRPLFSSSLERFDGDFEGLDLQSLGVKLRLEGAELEITPNQYYDGGWHADWDNQEEVHIGVEGTSLGVAYDTRGIIWDISDHIADLNLDEEIVRRYRGNDVEVEEILYHTSAHFLLLLISDMTGINPSLLHYGYDKDQEIVYVFEEAEGGQGISDYFYEMLEPNPGRILESMVRVGYNSQIENERLWSKEEFVSFWKEELEISEDLDEVIGEMSDILFPSVLSKIKEESINTFENLQEAKESLDGFSVVDVIELKHDINELQVNGNEVSEEFLEEKIGDISEEKMDAVQNLLIPPDIDGCIANLHLSHCKTSREQNEVLSYYVLQEILGSVLNKASEDERDETVIEAASLSAGRFDGKSIFLSF